MKLAAGWLIEHSGWKGHSRETHGVHDKQALVLVHFGGATGQEVWSLAQDVMASVHEKFGVQLEPEVNQIQMHSIGWVVSSGSVGPFLNIFDLWCRES